MSSKRLFIQQYVEQQKSVTDSIALNINAIEKFIDLIDSCRALGNNIFVAGNGGSLSNATHFVQDLGKGASDAIRTKLNSLRFKSIALDNISWITALGNDYDYSRVFVDQLKSLAKENDLFVGISVSGTSPNIINAMKWARSNYLNTVALTGNKKNFDKPSIVNIADVVIRLNDEHFGKVEDAMMTVLHLVCYYFIDFVGKKYRKE